jgi:hypothetical protein
MRWIRLIDKKMRHDKEADSTQVEAALVVTQLDGRS